MGLHPWYHLKFAGEHNQPTCALHFRNVDLKRAYLLITIQYAGSKATFPCLLPKACTNRLFSVWYPQGTPLFHCLSKNR